MTMTDFSINDEVIDVEWAALNGKLPPKGRKYRYKVDGEIKVTNKESLTGREVLESVGKTPEAWILRQRIRGKWMTVKADEPVDFTTAGVEKFKTLPNDQTDGEQTVKSPRRDFTLLEEDEDFLNSLELEWETLKEDNGNKWIFVHGYPVSKGYNVDQATLAMLYAPGYPDAQLDMVFFSPALFRDDGQPIPNTSPLPINGVEFQQWSRHRSGENPWRPGIDNVSTHYPLAEVWLLNEFEKRPRYAVPA